MIEAAKLPASQRESLKLFRRLNSMASTGSTGDSQSSRSGKDSDPSDAPIGKISEYEKQRFSRIAENKARLEALGISKAAKSLLAPSRILRKRRGKQTSGEEDDEYRPGDDDDEDFLGDSTSVSRYRKKKKKKKTTSVSSKRKVLPKKNLDGSDSLAENESDDDLNKAIALSLQDAVAGGSRTVPTKKMRNDEEAGSCKKRKPELMSRTQMTEDELVIYFYQFDEAGKGFINLRDLGKMARVHDFTWTEEELQDMIHCFDLDKDGKLSLDEFRKIVMRCRMMKQF